MNADDLQDLYNALRGSRSALAVLDARTWFVEKQMVKAHTRLLDAHRTYQESRARLLKQDAAGQYDAKSKDGDRQIRRIKRKQEKAREILEVFDDLLPQLEKLARREQARQSSAPAPATNVAPKSAPLKQPPPESVEESTPEPVPEPEPVPTEQVDGNVEINVARPSSVSEKFLDEFQENWGDDQLAVVGREYDFTSVDSDEDIHTDALYYLRNGDESMMVQTPEEDTDDAVMLVNVVSKKPLRPLPREAFIALGRQRKMVLLLDRHSDVVRAKGAQSSGSSTTDQEIARPAASTDASKSPGGGEQAKELTPEQKFLDMGAFSQLMESAQRCGLVPGADQIGFTRDREFRSGNYDLALQIIEGLFSKFTASAAARKQALTREDADIAAGRIKISPKDLLAKRARDRAQDQAIDRARSRFNRVLDGLRVLIKNS